MAERSIIMTGESVPAIFADRKGMTRRIVRPQPWPTATNMRVVADRLKFDASDPRDADKPPHERRMQPYVRCPYGMPGETLWVRESFRIADSATVGHDRFHDVRYRADEITAGCFRWRSPMLMPRWASRLALEITGVRVERLQDITEADARAEGIDWPGEFNGARAGFIFLWDRINGSRAPWASNPWIWCISFRRLP